MGSFSTNNNNTTVLAAGVALVVASLGLGYMTVAAATASPPSSSSSSSSSKRTPSTSEQSLATVTEIDDDDNEYGNANNNADGEEMIEEQDVCQIFDKLFLELQNAFAILMNQVQQLQMAGQQIPEGQLKTIMRQELERALMTKQAAIVEDAGIDPDCLEEAVWEFLELENRPVRLAVERVQKLWQTATGEPVVGWRPGKGVVFPNNTEEEVLDPETTIRAAEAYFNALSDCMRTLIGQYQAAGRNLQTDAAVQRALNLDFAAAANDAGEVALSNMGVSQSKFEASITEHKNNAQVSRALAMLQMKQGQDFSAMQQQA